MPVASMPMYNIPELQSALDGLWSGFSRHLKRQGLYDVPERIEHNRNLKELWNDPDMWFSQCCGFDIIGRYAGKLRPIATPHFGATGCKGADYASFIVVGEDCKVDDVLNMFGSICVVNGLESHSGSNALKALVAPRHREGQFFSRIKVSGSHVASLEMLQTGKADVAAVDCVTYALLETYRPHAINGLRILGRTYRAPAIPYVTRWASDVDKVERLQTAIFNAFSDVHLTAIRQSLFLQNIEVLPISEYQRINEFGEYAERLGYGKLR